MNDLMLKKLDVSTCNVTKHLVSNGGNASLAATTAGDGSASLVGDDVAGTITFADTWADGDTIVVTYANAYENAPIVLLTGAQNVNASGVVLVEVDTLASATTAFTITASGTCVGSLGYLVIGQ